MEALHIIAKDPIKKSETDFISASTFAFAYTQLCSYLEGIKTTKDDIGFKEHEGAVTRLIYTLGQAALSEVLSHYDTHSDVIRVGEQTYRRKHKAPKEYQTALGAVTIKRHV